MKQNLIPIDNLIEKLKTFLERKGLSSLDCKITIENENDWSLILSSPFDGDIIEPFLEEIGVDENRCVFFGLNPDTKNYEWYFTHPETPSDILAGIDDESDRRELEEDEQDETSECLEANPQIPIPKRQKTGGDTCFLVLQRIYFEDIESGEKTVEFRELNQYYADKLLGKENPLRFVKFQLGYGGPGHQTPRQMVFEIESIVLVDDFMDEFPAYRNDGIPTTNEDVPSDFCPTMYGIKLGARIS